MYNKENFPLHHMPQVLQVKYHEEHNQKFWIDPLICSNDTVYI